jgi:hypothetical protein
MTPAGPPPFRLSQRAVVESFGGFGVQLNQHVYAAITGLPEERFHDLEEKVVSLRPHVVRLFYNDRQEGDPADPAQTQAQKDKWASLVRTARLAQRAGAAIDLTWQSGALATRPERDRSMRRFSDVIGRLTTAAGVTNLRWAAIQNEPNSPPSRGHAKIVTPARLGELYRLLDQRLAERGLRDRLGFMGGDLLEGSRDPSSPLNQQRWLAYLSRHLADLLDAYSVHIYWDYDDPGRFQRRLAGVRRIVDALPQPKPVYVTEFGIRSKDRRQRGVVDPGTFRDRQGALPLCQTNVAAFQQAWFQVRAAQLGFTGTMKWDCHFGRYDQGRQAYYAIGPPGADGWPLYPAYFLLQLFTLTTAPGWRVLAVEPADRGDSRQLAALSGPDGELTIFGLDRGGALLNSTSSRKVEYRIGGLPPGRRLDLLLWNRTGGGRLVRDGAVTTDPDGSARLRAPLHSVFALTSKPLPAL